MPTSKSEFSLKKRVIEFEDPVRPLFSTQVQIEADTIINSITDHTTKLRKWKVRVARAVKEKRGQGVVEPFMTVTRSRSSSRTSSTLVITYSQDLDRHQLRSTASENFVKPVIFGGSVSGYAGIFNI